MNEVIDAAIAGAQPESAAQAEPGVVEQPTDATQEPKKTGNPRVDDPWPDSARKAMNRVKQERAQAKYEAQRLREELKAREAPQAKETPKDGQPTEDQFDNYGEFLKAQMKWEMKQELQGFQEKQQTTQQEQHKAYQEQVWQSERLGAIDKQIGEMKTTIPDFEAVEAQNEELIGELTQIPHVFKAFLEADNAPLAFYALAKEGKLEGLAGLSPAKVAMEIAKAEVRGESMLKKPVTNAPTPMAPVKGVGGGAKSLDSMEWNELKTWMKS